MTASITDVAALAGVSVATVSRALRGLDNVAPATMARVHEAAAALDYVVNPNASRLAGGRNHTVAAVLPYLTGWYFQKVLAGAQAVLDDAGYDMLLYVLPTPGARTRFLEVTPFRKRVDGVLLIDVPLTEAERARLAGHGTAVVGVGQQGAHFPGVVIDNVAAGRTATDHLLDLGHTRIGLISGLLEDPMRFTVGRDRRAGWEAALHARGIDPPPAWQFTGDFRMADGAAGMLALLQRDPEITAVFCMSDEMAIGAIHGLRDIGLRCPEDVSVIGFDDHEVSSYISLTTVAQPMRLVGRTAASLLLEGIGDPDARRSRGMDLPTSLVTRGTTGRVRVLTE